MPCRRSSAGPDVQLPFGSAVYVRGNDQRRWPARGFVSAKWSKVSGPRAVMFGSPRKFKRRLVSALGTYVLRLTANDGLLSASDDMTVVVGTSPLSTQPAGVRGTDQSGRGPGDTIVGRHRLTDDGLPGSPNALTASGPY